MARDERKRNLPTYSADEEEITENRIQVIVHNHTSGPTASQPDIKVETETEVSLGPLRAKRVPAWVIALVGVGGIGITALVTKLLGG